MNNLSYTFTMLFLAYFSDNIKYLAYDESFSIVEKVYNHWRLTDSLYSRYDSISSHDSIDDYLKTNAENIKFLIADMTKV